MSGTSVTAGTAAVEPMAIAFAVQVTAVQDLGANFRRITFGGYSLRQFGVHGELLDARIKVIIPPRTADGWAELPEFDAHDEGWYQQWLALPEDERGSMRTYSVRQARLDAAYPEIDVDFVLHGVHGEGDAGPAATWAAQATAGDRLTIIGPNNRAAHCITAQTYGGIEWRPGLAQRVLLAGDETAVPAICAILETLPAYMSGHAFLEVPEAGDFQDVRTAADVEITWLARGASLGRSRPHGEVLQEAVRRAVPFPATPGSGPRPAPPWREPSPRTSTSTPRSSGTPRSCWIRPRWRRLVCRAPRRVLCRSTRGWPGRPVWSRRSAATWCATPASTVSRWPSWVTGATAACWTERLCWTEVLRPVDLSVPVKQ